MLQIKLVIANFLFIALPSGFLVGIIPLATVAGMSHRNAHSERPISAPRKVCARHWAIPRKPIANIDHHRLMVSEDKSLSLSQRRRTKSRRPTGSAAKREATVLGFV
jgi:hypothetical protein